VRKVISVDPSRGGDYGAKVLVEKCEGCGRIMVLDVELIRPGEEEEEEKEDMRGTVRVDRLFTRRAGVLWRRSGV